MARKIRQNKSVLSDVREELAVSNTLQTIDTTPDDTSLDIVSLKKGTDKLSSNPIIPSAIYLLKKDGMKMPSIISQLGISMEEYSLATVSDAYKVLAEQDLAVKSAELDMKRLNRVSKEGGILDTYMDIVEYTILPYMSSHPEEIPSSMALMINKLIDRVENVSNSVQNVININNVSNADREKLERKFISTSSDRINKIYEVGSPAAIATFNARIMKALEDAELEIQGQGNTITINND